MSNGPLGSLLVDWGKLLGLLLDVLHNEDELLVGDLAVMVWIKFHY